MLRQATQKIKVCMMRAIVNAAIIMTVMVMLLGSLLLLPSLKEAAYLYMVFPPASRSPAYSILQEMYFVLQKLDLSMKKSYYPVESGRTIPANSLASITLP